MRLGLVGYGGGGRYFHAPFIEAATGVDLAGVVTHSPDRRQQVVADYPNVAVYESIGDLLESGVDAVTISTPPQSRKELVLAAIGAGMHVVADKPFAPTADDARDLVDAAREAGVVLSVFHNRRWDADFRTLKAVIDRGDLGKITRIESRFDADDAGTLEAGPSGGLLRDIGSHLVDQVLWLLGPALTVHADLEWVDLPEGRTDSGFTISIAHDTGSRSVLSSSKVNRIQERELRAYGTAGGYVSRSTDVQAAAVFAGQRPAQLGEDWGYEPESAWGTINNGQGPMQVPSERGAYQDYYTQFAAAVRGDADSPVPAEQAVQVVAVLDAARTSALETRVVTL
jgi:predicted dehydrogenase